MNTPWGVADEVTRIARGLTWVGTPSHGGFLVGRGYAQKNLTPQAIAKGESFGSYLAYEEDCLASIILYEVPQAHQQLFPTADLKTVFDNLSTWNADYLLARGLKPSEPGFSYFQKNHKENQLRESKGPLVIAAWGSWAPGVRQNHVRVELADGRKFIIPALEYQSLPSTEIPTIDKFPNAVEETFRVHLGGKKYRTFTTLEEATAFCNEVAARTREILAIEAVS